MIEHLIIVLGSYLLNYDGYLNLSPLLQGVTTWIDMDEYEHLLPPYCVLRVLGWASFKKKEPDSWDSRRLVSKRYKILYLS